MRTILLVRSVTTLAIVACALSMAFKSLRTTRKCIFGWCQMWVLVAILFLGSSVGKIARPASFMDYLVHGGYFSVDIARWIHALVISVELGCAGLLIWPATRRGGWILAAALSSSFLVMHVASAVLGHVRACHCFGFEITRDSLTSHVLMGSLCLSILGAASNPKNSNPSRGRACPQAWDKPRRGWDSNSWGLTPLLEVAKNNSEMHIWVVSNVGSRCDTVLGLFRREDCAPCFIHGLSRAWRLFLGRHRTLDSCLGH